MQTGTTTASEAEPARIHLHSALINNELQSTHDDEFQNSKECETKINVAAESLGNAPTPANSEKNQTNNNRISSSIAKNTNRKPLLRPIHRTKIVITHVKIVDSELPLLVPSILRHVSDEATLRECLKINWCFMEAASSRLYENISLFGASGPLLLRLLKLMTRSANNETIIDYRCCVKSLEIADIVLDEQEVTPFQSWNLVRELIRRTASTLERIYLESTDDARFHDPELIRGCGLDQRVLFPNLKSLTIGPGCTAFSETFIADLLKRCTDSTLISIRLPGCLASASEDLFSLIAVKGGTALQDLILTPSNAYPPATGNPFVDVAIGPPSAVLTIKEAENVADTQLALSDWDFAALCKGIASISFGCTDLRALDLSGHTRGLDSGVLAEVLEKCSALEELDLPCGATDALMHEILLAQPKCLWRINASCGCRKSISTSGDKQKDGEVAANVCSCFTDTVVRALVDEVLAGKIGALLELPAQVMQVRDAKMVATADMLERDIAGAKRVDGAALNEKEDVFYVSRIGVRVVVKI
ncbi:hypothetical protein HK100_006529 [Physocladia obscura]|uniref:Uncharacterized protein n=1 Tax=Physocladia obscura TaxID=109957 RepID=A0AAD5SQE2_9FUNG|nr:hypothetical protein HK100_006529 [Physocladia obscura]